MLEIQVNMIAPAIGVIAGIIFDRAVRHRHD